MPHRGSLRRCVVARLRRCSLRFHRRCISSSPIHLRRRRSISSPGQLMDLHRRSFSHCRPIEIAAAAVPKPSPSSLPLIPERQKGLIDD
ncbi:hypothetical protein LINPERHAP1_LOCUS31461 [Linum perenne]